MLDGVLYTAKLIIVNHVAGNAHHKQVAYTDRKYTLRYNPRIRAHHDDRIRLLTVLACIYTLFRRHVCAMRCWVWDTENSPLSTFPTRLTPISFLFAYFPLILLPEETLRQYTFYFNYFSKNFCPCATNFSAKPQHYLSFACCRFFCKGCWHSSVLPL